MIKNIKDAYKGPVEDPPQLSEKARLLLILLAERDTMPTKSRTKAAAELVRRGLATGDSGYNRLFITPAGRFAAKDTQ